MVNLQTRIKRKNDWCHLCGSGFQAAIKRFSWLENHSHEKLGLNQRPPAELGVWGWPLEGAETTSAGGRWFISIHKPPASIRFAPIKHALVVTVEPFNFSSASRWLMNWDNDIDPIPSVSYKMLSEKPPKGPSRSESKKSGSDLIRSRFYGFINGPSFIHHL